VSGSGAGKKAAVENTVDFAGSDSILTHDEYARGQDLQMLPMLAGADVVIYNVENISGIPSLVLDRETLVGIYNGTIAKWNDPQIRALNPERAASLPDKPIIVVHRSDGSGTTEIFTKGLASFSNTWKEQVGAGPKVDWPVDRVGRGIGREFNSGVAAAVASTPNSIGYVELAYAVSNNLLYARLKNRAGNIVGADAENVQAAMSDFAGTFGDKLTVDLVDGPGQASWPLAGYTYLIVHTRRMSDCTKAQKLLEYIRWTLTDDFAQQRATALGYSPLPPDVRELVLKKLRQVSCQNKPVLAP
jgi:phosphate transport system substrate-binding protein